MLSPEQMREGKLCLSCGRELVRRQNEKSYAFKRRVMCDQLCANIYSNRRRWENHVPLPRMCFEEKFIPEPNSGCFLWVGATVPDGYGSFGISNKKTIKAHRMSWILYRGQIPRGAHVLHRCDNRACVNPDHLFLGDNTLNVADRVAKGRSTNKIKRDDFPAILNDKRSQSAIARDWGVSQSTIWRIKRMDESC